MRRRILPSNILIAWLALAALPTLLSLSVAFMLTRRHDEHDALALAEANAERLATIVEEGGRLLDRLARTTRAQCNVSSVAELNEVLFRSLYFRTAGIEHGQQQICTQRGLDVQPINRARALPQPLAISPSLVLYPPNHSQQQGESIVLKHRISADNDRSIFLLLNPDELKYISDHFKSQDVGTYLMRGPDLDLAPIDGVLRSNLKIDRQLLLSRGVHRDSEGLYAVVQSADLPLYIVVFTSNAELSERWRKQLWIAIPAGIAFTLLAGWLLRRVLPRPDERDDLRQGIVGKEMEIWYQPIVDARRQETMEAEALVRWRHPKRGLVMPDDFIPLAERSGLIEALTEFVLSQVKRDLDILAPLPHTFRISVNLSRVHLSDDRLLGVVDRVFGIGSRLDHLGFEVTERELLTPVIDQAHAVLSALAARGAQIALDDFGTGYSSLSYLRHLPLDHLKIDHSFIWAMDTEAVTAHLVDSVVSLAQALEIELVAEGVETQAQRERLLARGVNLQQGLLYAGAMPCCALQEWLARGNGASFLPAPS